MRIPSRVVLPFGYRISVRQLSDTEMDRRDSNADGIWDDETKTIYLRKRLPVTRRRYILAHELGHAWLDWQREGQDLTGTGLAPPRERIYLFDSTGRTGTAVFSSAS